MIPTPRFTAIATCSILCIAPLSSNAGCGTPSAPSASYQAQQAPSTSYLSSTSTELLFTDQMLRDQGSAKPSLPLPALSGAAGAVAAGLGGLTGSMVDGFLTSATNGVLSHVREIGDHLARTLAENLRAAQTQLRDILADQITKPINELNTTMRLAVDRALVIIASVSAALDATVRCVVQDAKTIAAAADVSISANVRDAAFWSGEKSFVGGGYVLGSDSRIGIHAQGAPVSYKFVGAFNGMDTTCSEPLATLYHQDKPLALRTVSADPRAITVELPRFPSAGVFRVDLSYQRRSGLFRRCESKRQIVQATVVVSPDPSFGVMYTARARCNVQSTSTQVTTLDFGNDRCEGDKHGSVQLCPGTGERYYSHAFADDSRNGCPPANIERQAGDCVRASGTCPERGGILCTGTRKWLNGRLFLTTTKTTPTDAATVLKGSFVTRLGYAQTARQILFDPSSSQVSGAGPAAQCEWTISADIEWPGGAKRTSIPSRTGTGPLTSAADSTTFDFNPNDGSLTISTPPYNCPYIQ